MMNYTIEKEGDLLAEVWGQDNARVVAIALAAHHDAPLTIVRMKGTWSYQASTTFDPHQELCPTIPPDLDRRA